MYKHEYESLVSISEDTGIDFGVLYDKFHASIQNVSLQEACPFAAPQEIGMASIALYISEASVVNRPKKTVTKPKKLPEKKTNTDDVRKAIAKIAATHPHDGDVKDLQASLQDKHPDLASAVDVGIQTKANLYKTVGKKEKADQTPFNRAARADMEKRITAHLAKTKSDDLFNAIQDHKAAVTNGDKVGMVRSLKNPSLIAHFAENRKDIHGEVKGLNDEAASIRKMPTTSKEDKVARKKAKETHEKKLGAWLHDNDHLVPHLADEARKAKGHISNKAFKAKYGSKAQDDGMSSEVHTDRKADVDSLKSAKENGINLKTSMVHKKALEIYNSRRGAPASKPSSRALTVVQKSQDHAKKRTIMDKIKGAVSAVKNRITNSKIANIKVNEPDEGSK